MTGESLMRLCAELGIKLTLTGDNNDRLQVDAPKGAMTSSLREALAARKPELIAILKTENNQVSKQAQAPTSSQTSEPAKSHAPASNWNSPEANPLIQEQPLPSTQFERTHVEVKKLLSGNEYEASMMDTKDSATRQIIGAHLLAALAGRNSDEHENARRAFMDHGYFDDATKQLRTADSPAERAAAARKLGVLRDFRSTAHLIESLDDSAPEVRRASVE